MDESLRELLAASPGHFCTGTVLVGSLMALVFTLTLVVSTPLESRRLKKQRADFVRDRDALTDEDFLRRNAAEPRDALFHVTARHVMAELCHVPAEFIRPDDTVRSLLDLQFDNGFIQDFIFELEARAGVFLKEAHTARALDAMTFAAFIRALAQGAKSGGRSAAAIG